MRSKERTRIGRMTKAKMWGVSVFKAAYVHAHIIRRVSIENNKQKTRWAKDNVGNKKMTESKQKVINSTEGNWRRQWRTEKEKRGEKEAGKERL